MSTGGVRNRRRRLVCSPAVAPAPIHLRPTASLAPPRAPARRPRAGAGARAGALRRARADVQPPPRPVGLHGHRARRRAAHGPEHGHRRPERGDRARGALRPRGAPRDPGRHGRRRCAAEPARGQLVAVEEALAADGASRALGAPSARPATPLSPRRSRGGPIARARRLGRPVPRSRPERRDGWARAGAVALDLETAALLAVARGGGSGPGAAGGRSPTRAAASTRRRSTRLASASGARRWPPSPRRARARPYSSATLRRS